MPLIIVFMFKSSYLLQNHNFITINMTFITIMQTVLYAIIRTNINLYSEFFSAINFIEFKAIKQLFIYVYL